MSNFFLGSNIYQSPCSPSALYSHSFEKLLRFFPVLLRYSFRCQSILLAGLREGINCEVICSLQKDVHQFSLFSSPPLTPILHCT